MGKLNDIGQQALRRLVGSRCYNAAGLAIGTTKSKVKTANAISFSILGKMYAKAGTDDFFVHTDVTVQPVGTTRAYLLCIDKDGAALVVREQAPELLGTGTGQRGTTSGKLPDMPDGYAPVGAIKVVTDATHTFTPGTTFHDAAGVTTTYVDLACMIDTL